VLAREDQNAAPDVVAEIVRRVADQSPDDIELLPDQADAANGIRPDAWAAVALEGHADGEVAHGGQHVVLRHADGYATALHIGPEELWRESEIALDAEDPAAHRGEAATEGGTGLVADEVIGSIPAAR